MARILILREIEAAKCTARRIEAAGHEAVLLPVQTILPLSPALPPGPFAGLIVTSANALCGPALSALRHLPVLAVGQTSARAARAAGFSAEAAGDGTGAGLVQSAAALAARTGRPLLYAAGRVRTDGLENALRASGIPHETIETYDTVDLEIEAAAVEAAFARPVDAALILSLGQARAFSRLLLRFPEETMPVPRALCLSSRIRDGLSPALAAQALVAPERELSSLLRRYDHPDTAEP